MTSGGYNKKGDHFAGDLVNMQEQLFYYALQLTEDREDARDLVQETSYKALKNRSRLHDNLHFRAWLYTILRNTYINYLRSSHNRQIFHDTEELNQLYARNNNSEEDLPDASLIKKELYDVINLLPAVYEKPINMFLNGYSYKEISQHMRIPIGTVKSRIFLGKKEIRKVYAS